MNVSAARNVKTIWVLALIAVLTLTAYSFGLNGSFRNIDDRFSIADSPTIKDTSNVGKIFQGGFFNDHSYYRPLVSLSFMLEYHFFGQNAWYYYLDNIVLHILTSAVVFLIAGILFQNKTPALNPSKPYTGRFSCDAGRASGSGLAAGAALLFAIHPIHWEAVANIPGRSNLLCGFFYLSAFLGFLFFEEGKGRRYFYLSIFSFFLALLSKESAVMLPVVMIWYVWMSEAQSPRKKLGHLKVVLPFFALIFSYAYLRRSLEITELFPWPSAQDSLLGFLTFLRGVLTYVRLFVFPMDLHFDRSRPVFTSFFDPELLGTVLFYWVLIALVLKYQKHLGRLILFCAGWFSIELFPVSQIISVIGTQPGSISLAEHFLYSASVGIFIIMVLAAEQTTAILIQKRIFTSLSVSFLIFGIMAIFFLTTIQNNIYAASELAMLQRSLHFNPRNTRILYAVGFLCADHRRFEEAEKYFRKVIELEPANATARIALGKSLCDQERYYDGLMEYEKVIVPPGALRELLKNNMRLASKILIEKYEKRIEKDPQNARLYYSEGIVFHKNHQIPEAIEAYRKALKVDPNFKPALFNLGSALAGQGELDEAAFYYERLLSLEGPKDELDQRAYQYLGHIYGPPHK